MQAFSAVMQGWRTDGVLAQVARPLTWIAAEANLIRRRISTRKKFGADQEQKINIIRRCWIGWLSSAKLTFINETVCTVGADFNVPLWVFDSRVSVVGLATMLRAGSSGVRSP